MPQILLVVGIFYTLFTHSTYSFAGSPDRAHAVEKIQSWADDIAQRFSVPETSPEALLGNLADKSLVIVDVREPVEVEVSTIPGSITKQAFTKNLDKYKKQKIVAFCTIGYRSSAWVKTIRQKGFDASNLRGSILMWTHINGPLVDPQDRPTKTVHMSSAPASLLAKGYLPTP